MHIRALSQQVVVVMGASSGIGRATALLLARRGARVVAAARGEEGLVSLVERIRRTGGSAIAVRADVSDPDQVKGVADLAIQEYGRIDAWVHLSAVSAASRFEDMRTEELERILSVNLLGQMYGALAALPHLRRAGGGALIHVSSVEAAIALPFQSAYAASKHGVTGFVDSLRLELAREGAPIRVTNIMPSSINTPFYDKALTRLGVKPRGTAPMYEPEIVANAIVHAIEHPVRDLVIGGAGMALLIAHRISPLLSDALLSRRPGFEGQWTDEPRSPDAENNLFEPSDPRYVTARGSFEAEARRSSLFTAIETSSIARLLGVSARVVFAVVAKAVETAWLVTLPPSARAMLPRRVVLMPPRPQRG